MWLDIYINEDLKDGDATSEALLEDQEAKARIFTKQSCIAAGLTEAMEVFLRLGATCELAKYDGDRCDPQDALMHVSGKVKALMEGERLALNLIGRMSGIATDTKMVLDKVKAINPDATIAATRKTTPGFREMEKRAVAIGGGDRHRFNLGDRILIKDNHIAIVGSVEEAVRLAVRNSKDLDIEVEVENLEDAVIAAQGCADIVMLDNMTPAQCEEAYMELKERYPALQIETSGGITPDNISDYAKWADVISMGWLTYNSRNIDVSMEMEP